MINAKRYQNIFDQSISEFVSSEYLKREIEEEFSNKIARLDPKDIYYDARKNSLEVQKKKQLDAVFSMKKLRQKKHKNTIKEVDEKIKDEEICPKTKSIIEFDPSLTCSITSLAVKKIMK